MRSHPNRTLAPQPHQRPPQRCPHNTPANFPAIYPTQVAPLGTPPSSSTAAPAISRIAPVAAQAQGDLHSASNPRRPTQGTNPKSKVTPLSESPATDPTQAGSFQELHGQQEQQAEAEFLAGWLGYTPGKADSKQANREQAHRKQLHVSQGSVGGGEGDGGIGRQNEASRQLRTDGEVAGRVSERQRLPRQQRTGRKVRDHKGGLPGIAADHLSSDGAVGVGASLPSKRGNVKQPHVDSILGYAKEGGRRLSKRGARLIKRGGGGQIKGEGEGGWVAVQKLDVASDGASRHEVEGSTGEPVEHEGGSEDVWLEHVGGRLGRDGGLGAQFKRLGQSGRAGKRSQRVSSSSSMQSIDSSINTEEVQVKHTRRLARGEEHSETDTTTSLTQQGSTSRLQQSRCGTPAMQSSPATPISIESISRISAAPCSPGVPSNSDQFAPRETNTQDSSVVISRMESSSVQAGTPRVSALNPTPHTHRSAFASPLAPLPSVHASARVLPPAQRVIREKLHAASTWVEVTQALAANQREVTPALCVYALGRLSQLRGSYQESVSPTTPAELSLYRTLMKRVLTAIGRKSQDQGYAVLDQGRRGGLAGRSADISPGVDAHQGLGVAAAARALLAVHELGLVNATWEARVAGVVAEAGVEAREKVADVLEQLPTRLLALIDPRAAEARGPETRGQRDGPWRGVFGLQLGNQGEREEDEFMEVLDTFVGQNTEVGESAQSEQHLDCQSTDAAGNRVVGTSEQVMDPQMRLQELQDMETGSTAATQPTAPHPKAIRKCTDLLSSARSWQHVKVALSVIPKTSPVPLPTLLRALHISAGSRLRSLRFRPDAVPRPEYLSFLSTLARHVLAIDHSSLNARQTMQLLCYGGQLGVLPEAWESEAAQKLMVHVPRGTPEAAAAAMLDLSPIDTPWARQLFDTCRTRVEDEFGADGGQLGNDGYADYLAALTARYAGTPGYRAREIESASVRICLDPELSPVAAAHVLDACLEVGVADVALLKFALSRVEAKKQQMGSTQHARFLGTLAHVAIAHETLVKHVKQQHVYFTLAHMSRSNTPTFLRQLVATTEHIALLVRHAPHLATHQVQVQLAELLGRIQRFDEVGVAVGQVPALQLLHAFGLLGIKSRNHVAALVAILSSTLEFQNPLALGARLRLAPLLPDTTVHHDLTYELPELLYETTQAKITEWDCDNLLTLCAATAEHYRDGVGEYSGVGRFLHPRDWGGLSTPQVEPSVLGLLLSFEDFISMNSGKYFRELELIRVRAWVDACNEASFGMDAHLLQGLVGMALERRWAQSNPTFVAALLRAAVVAEHRGLEVPLLLLLLQKQAAKLNPLVLLSAAHSAVCLNCMGEDFRQVVKSRLGDMTVQRLGLAALREWVVVREVVGQGREMGRKEEEWVAAGLGDVLRVEIGVRKAMVAAEKQQRVGKGGKGSRGGYQG